MNDLISRQAAIDVLSLGKEILSRVLDDMDVVGADREKYSWGIELIESNIKDIEQLPSAQPELERTGRWCFNTDGKLVCSNCYETPTNRILLYGDMIFDMTPIREKMKYCPNCGARMKEGEVE